MRVTGESLTNWRLAVWPMTRRTMSWVSSQGARPPSSRMALISRGSLSSNTASTEQESSPVRISDLSARSPSTSLSAPTMTDLPAPVSPVTPIRPGPSSQTSSSTRARLRILRRVSIRIFADFPSIAEISGMFPMDWLVFASGCGRWGVDPGCKTLHRSYTPESIIRELLPVNRRNRPASGGFPWDSGFQS
jgi:hypothetical protein